MPLGKALRPGGTRRSGTLLVALGAALARAGLVALLWPDSRIEADAGADVRAPTAVTPAVPAPEAGDVATAVTEPSPPTIPPAEPTKGFVPNRLVVDPLELASPLLEVTVDTSGALVPPQDPDDLGWWRGVRPGVGQGSVIVTGHVDSRQFGQGPLGRIVDLEPGDLAVVSGQDGESASYTVRGIQTFDKDEFPADDLFGTDGPERLVLVTCGGTFDPERRGWDSNIVAVLDPVAG